jgi:8-oxo-dGTP pyrophosphatase MutT (NUDIX family)
MTYLTNTHEHNHKQSIFTWLPEISYQDLSPVTQAYGFCFNKNNKLLVINSIELHAWQVPGGTIEEGETPEQALSREIEEEANVTINDIHYLGAQKVDDLEGNIAYQPRFACRVGRLNKRQIDYGMCKSIICTTFFVASFFLFWHRPPYY